MIDLAIKLLLLIACSVILLRVEPALNRMSPCTPWRMRYAALLLAGGALSGLFGLLDGGKPSLATTCLAAGIAALLLADRRRSHIHRPPHHQGDRHA